MSERVIKLWAAKDELVRPNSLSAYIFATICVAFATLVRLAVYNQVTLLFPTYYVAVLLVSLVGGFRVSLYAILLSVLAAWWLFMPLAPQYGPISPTQVINIIFFAGISLAIAAIGNLNRALLADLKEQRDHSQLLQSELSHRGKNLLMVVQSIVSQTIKDGAVKAALLSRIGSLALTDEFRATPGQQFVDLQQIALRQLSSFPNRVSIQGPHLLLGSMLTKVTVLILHELVTNAAKYGALSSQSVGRVVLTWSINNGAAHIVWRERGTSPVTRPSGRGTGLILIDRLAKTVGGAFSSNFAEEGVVHEITFPLPEEGAVLLDQP